MLDATVHAKVSEMITTAQGSQRLRDLHLIIDQVEEFYGKAWDTILWEAGVLTGLFGVIIPLIAGYIARNRIRSLENRIAREIEEQTTSARAQMTEQLRQHRIQLQHYQNAIGWVIKANKLQADIDPDGAKKEPTIAGKKIALLDTLLRLAIEYSLAHEEEEFNKIYATLRGDEGLSQLTEDEARQMLSSFTIYIEESKAESRTLESKDSLDRIENIEQLLAAQTS